MLVVVADEVVVVEGVLDEGPSPDAFLRTLGSGALVPGGLVVVSGVGRTQEWGKPVQELRAGDVVWCPPGVKHWHGASPMVAMTHLAVTGTLDGKNVQWMEKVGDEQYTSR